MLEGAVAQWLNGCIETCYRVNVGSIINYASILFSLSHITVFFIKHTFNGSKTLPLSCIPFIHLYLKLSYQIFYQVILTLSLISYDIKNMRTIGLNILSKYGDKNTEKDEFLHFLKIFCQN